MPRLPSTKKRKRIGIQKGRIRLFNGHSLVWYGPGVYALMPYPTINYDVWQKVHSMPEVKAALFQGHRLAYVRDIDTQDLLEGVKK